MKLRWALFPASLALVFAAAVPVWSQSAASRLVTRPIDEAQRVTLRASVHPLVRTAQDLGRVADALPAERILLLLNRPPEREAALQQLLRDVHNKESASYHKWVTPAQFGQRFGPADTDIQAAVSWLQARGFSVARVAKSRLFIEFSGTAGQLRSALEADIHQYNLRGEVHYANARDLSVPAALGALVRGISPLNDFRAQPYVNVAGRAIYSMRTKTATPLWTMPNPFGTPNPYAFALAPEDFATQYDLTPLYQAGTDGTGQTIGIINASNIDISLVNAYRQLFGLPNNPTQVVIDGDDPGTLNNIDVEAYLDVEVSGAVAPNATVNLYISNGSDFQDPIALSAIRAIEDNEASVLSVSFGQCEQFLQNSGNQLWSSLWEEAAAQGQTVLVATGDTGPECSYGLGISVSGLASTPWNVAVGGTDFYYSDYATGGASATSLWNQTNDSNLGSLKAPLTEQVWNDPFGLNVISNGLQRGEIFGGGGGASSCATQSASAGCTGGYAKPAWQTGPGVPGDGVRDLPDVSLFASNGANLSAYPICAFAAECVPGSAASAEVLLVGGTSASSPAMAGIMALVDQKYGRQGQANYTLYALAQQTPSAFHDITLGSNANACFTGTTDCTVDTNGNNVTTVYSAGPGYDLASGLGSVDANVLVNNWNSTSLLPTTTTVKLSSTKIKHGTPITVTTDVAPSSGSGTPTGAVAILTTSTTPESQGQTVLTLNSGQASSSINFFPGGYYNVFANYSGDGVFSASKSSPVALDVTPENSKINFSVVNGETQASISNGGSIQYNVPLSLVIQPSGASAPNGQTDGNATGIASFSVDSTSGSVALNGAGVASWTTPALAIGTHTASASYSGDASFNASSATPVSFSVTKGFVFMRDAIAAPQNGPQVVVNSGGSLTVSVIVGPYYGSLFLAGGAPNTVGPTGTVTMCLGGQNTCGNPSYSQTVPLVALSGVNSQYSIATGTFTNVNGGQLGGYFFTALYNGDNNWLSQGLLDLTFISISSTAPSLAASTTTLNITPSSISNTQLATFTTTVSGSSGPAPTGEVDFYNNGMFLTYIFLPASSGSSASASFVLNSSWFLNNGPNQITAVYDGDSNYQGSTSAVVSLAVAQNAGDFTLAPQTPQMVVKSGGSASVDLNLASLSNFNGNVTFTCTPSSSEITCAVNPSTVMLNGTATTTVTINASAQAAGLSRDPRYIRGSAWLSATGFVVFGGLVLGGFSERKRKLALLLTLALFTALLSATGCGSGGTPRQQLQPPPPPANSATYSVLVTATGNNVVHTAKIIVVAD